MQKIDCKKFIAYIHDDGTTEIHDGYQIIKYSADFKSISYEIDNKKFLEHMQTMKKVHDKLLADIRKYEDDTMEMLRTATTEEELKEVNKRIDVLRD